MSMSEDSGLLPKEYISSDMGIVDELDDLPNYCVESLAMLELLEEMGFPSDELCFALLSDGLYWMVMVQDIRAIEQLDGDTLYPIKAVDLPEGQQLRTIYIEMIKAATRWGKASLGNRQRLLNSTMVREREAALKVELAKVKLLPTPRN